MEKGKRTKEKIVQTSAELFLKKGYSNTGLAEILKETNLSKGSFYFSFSSKQDLGIAVAEYFRTEYAQWFRTILNHSASWEEYVNGIAKDIENKIQQHSYYGCPFTCFATEVAVIDQEIASVCTQALEEFHDIFTEAMEKTGMDKGKAKQKALAAITMYEGFMVYYRISGSVMAIQLMRRELIELGEIER
jgi:TetR/AcrR family transcriptional repressor of lmrAB and yxaGH operons